MPPAKTKKGKSAEAEKPTATKVSKKPRKTASESDEEMGQEESPIDPKDEMIASLQEQVKLLKIEVKTLRKNVEKISPRAPGTPARKASKSAPAEPPATPKGRRASVGSSKPKDKGCSCKGNCSTKVCGCVKKDFYCLPTCKCSDQCQNQDPDEDENTKNKENAHNNTTVLLQEAASSSTESTPDPPKPKGLRPPNPLESSPEDNDDTFNPMAPRRQLARSPLQHKSSKGQKSKLYNPSEIPLPPPKDEPEEEELPPPAEYHEPHVDWERHMSQLVQCSKCCRSFFQYRLKTHERSCIKS